MPATRCPRPPLPEAVRRGTRTRHGLDRKDEALAGQRPAIVIAAGGRGSRIGGDKAERLLGGRRLIDHAVLWARAQGDCLAVSVRGALDVAGVALLPDREPDLGPVSALRSAIAFAAANGRDHVLLLGCDMPFLPGDLTPRLQAAIGGAAAALPRTDGHLQALAGLWRTELVTLEQWIAAGGRSLWRYADHAGMVAVDWPRGDCDPFTSIDTPADLAAAELRLKTPGR